MFKTSKWVDFSFLAGEFCKIFHSTIEEIQLPEQNNKQHQNKS